MPHFMKHRTAEESLETMADVIDTIQPTHMVMFVSPASGGKTTAMIRLVSKFMKQGMNGLFITIDTEESVTNRFSANGAESIPDAMNTMQFQNGGKIFVKQLALEEACPEFIKQYAVDITETTGVKFDFIAVDSLDGIQPYSAGAASHVGNRRTAEDIRAIGFDLDCRIVTTKTRNEPQAYSSVLAEITTADMVIEIETRLDVGYHLRLVKCRAYTPECNNSHLDNQ